MLATLTGPPRGVEAVIDKDLAAARLAIDLDADVLLPLTDVDGIYEDSGAGTARPLPRRPVDDLHALSPPDGSIAAKIEAICAFVEQRGWLGPSARCPTPPPSCG